MAIRKWRGSCGSRYDYYETDYKAKEDTSVEADLRWRAGLVGRAWDGGGGGSGGRAGGSGGGSW